MPITPTFPAENDPDWAPPLLVALGEMVDQGNATEAAVEALDTTVTGLAVDLTTLEGEVDALTSGVPISTLPAVGAWMADPFAQGQGGKDVWYVDSYMTLGRSINIDRIAVNVTKAYATSPTLTITMHPLTADGQIDTGTVLASGTVNVSTTGQKELTVAATIPVNGVAFRLSGGGAGSANLGLHFARKYGVGANVNSSPAWGQEPYPTGANTSLGNSQPLVYVRRAA